MIGLLGFTVEVAARTLTEAGGATYPQDIASRLSSYAHTITATGGFESCTLTFTALDLDEALAWADRLNSAVTCYGPDADVIWAGLIVSAELRVGGRSRVYALDGVANRVRVRYTTALGTPGATAAASNAASVALYGVRDVVLSLGNLDLVAATALRDAYLTDNAFPRGQGETSLAVGGGAGGAIEIVLTCAGRYDTLGNVVLERTDTSTEATTAQVSTLLGAAAPGIRAINSFLNPSLASGSSSDGVTRTRKIEADTTYRAAIEERLSLGNTSNQRYAWGVYADAALLVKPWAPAVAGSRIYRVRLADAVVTTELGGPVELWQVRPDAMVEDADLISVGPPSGAVESPSSFYLERVSFDVGLGGSMTLSLESSSNTSLTARLARVS